MNKKLLTLFLTALLNFTPLSPAFANPIPPSGKTTAFIGVFFLLALLAEVTVTLVLLKRYRLRLIRLGMVYLLANICSFILFVAVILRTFHGFGLFFPIPEVLAEAFVIVLETATLFMLMNLEWFRSDNSQEVSIKSTLVAVTAGNVTSIMFGFLLLLPPVFMLLK